MVRWARPLVAIYAVLLALVLLSPSSGIQSGLVKNLVDALRWAGLSPTFVTYARAEVVMNAVILVPLTFWGSFILRRLRWQDWTAYGFVGAALVETFQGLVLPHRQASFSDIVANTTGALLGAVIGIAVRRHVSPDE